MGDTGIEVSEIALGTWRFGGSRVEIPDVTEEAAHDLLDAYAAHGGNFIDTADRYGGGKSEEWIGDWLDGCDRGEFVIASKIGRRSTDRTDLSRTYLRKQIDRTLDRLGTDYLDVLYAHRIDDGTPTEQFVRTFDEFVRVGKVNCLGVSCGQPDAWKVAKANEIAARRGYEPFSVSQPRYNLVEREIERNYLDMCRDYGLGVVPYNPLGEGFLTGKYDRNQTPDTDTRAGREGKVVDRYFSNENFTALSAIEAVADDVGSTPAQVSIAWLMQHPDVTAPIVGARTVDQLEENLRAASVELTDEQFERLANAR